MSKKDSAELAALAVRAIEDLKGQDIVRLDVRKLTDVTDYLVIATGTSSRHVKSIADNVLEEMRKAGERPIGVEGADAGEWILADFGGVVVHVMGAEPRRFYAIDARNHRFSGGGAAFSAAWLDALRWAASPAWTRTGRPRPSL